MQAESMALNVIQFHAEVVIRPATRDDLPKLEWFGRYWHYRDVFRRTFEEHRAGRRLMLVADANDFPVGQLFVQFESVEHRLADGGRRAYIYSLRVLEPFQRHGIGTQLIGTAEQEIRARGFEWATIAVAKENVGARRLYERLGYRVIDEDAGRWSYTDPSGKRHHVNEPAWVLAKELA